MSKELSVEEVLDNYRVYDARDNYMTKEQALTAINRIRLQDMLDELQGIQLHKNLSPYVKTEFYITVDGQSPEARIAELETQIKELESNGE